MFKYNDVKILIFLVVFTLPLLAISQTPQSIYVQDIDNFWTAYDSIHSTLRKEGQIRFINKLYIEKASNGLKAFLKNKENVDSKWVELIHEEKSFWDSIRPKTLVVKDQVNNLQNKIDFLRKLYPALKDAACYFIIGFKQQGGTVRNNLSIIGTEVVASQPNANNNELTRICLHEYVHTQQTKPDFRNINVLTSSIREGACDFISELVLKQSLSLPYIRYGLKNEVDVWRVFEQDMLTSANDFWVSTGNNPALPTSDLGYYIGYAICKSYYNKARDKRQAIKEIIELDYADPNAVADFLKRSNYEKYITAKGYSQIQKLNIEGYVATPSKIVFSFSPIDKTVFKDEDGNYRIFDLKKDTVKSISVAGDFNNWDYKNSTFHLKEDKSGNYILSVNRDKFGKVGTKVKFRFILNKKYWIEPRFAISNRVTDTDGNTNLFIQL